MSGMHAGIHIDYDGRVEAKHPQPSARQGWIDIYESNGAGSDNVTIFPPDDDAAAITFLRRLAAAATELASVIKGA